VLLFLLVATTLYYAAHAQATCQPQSVKAWFKFENDINDSMGIYGNPSFFTSNNRTVFVNAAVGMGLQINNSLGYFSAVTITPLSLYSESFTVKQFSSCFWLRTNTTSQQTIFSVVSFFVWHKQNKLCELIVFYYKYNIIIIIL